MNSTLWIKIFSIEYVIILGFSLVEKNWARAAYFLGAFILNTALLYMK